MKIALAADHAGFPLKEKIKLHLKKKGFSALDLGTDSLKKTDYPDFAKKLAKTVTSKKVEKGILVCGSGLGMAMAANKVKGIRAVPCENIYTAKMSRAHNDANILCLGARILSKQKAFKIIDIWLETPFEGGRHIERIKKIETA